MNASFTHRPLLATVLALAATAASAAEPYVAVGLPGVVVGVAQPLSPHFSLRADLGTLGSRDDSGDYEGIDYRGDSHYHRLGLFGDWFPTGGGFRLSAGVTVNDGKTTLTAFGDGTPITIGNTTYATTAADRFEARIKLREVMPYLGIGWGHHESAGPGWHFVGDLGLSFGRASVTTSVEGPLLGQVSQEDLDAETSELRDGVGKIRVVPQITLGVGYRF